MDVPVAANVLGTIGAVCWSVQLLPQILVNYRRHHAVGLQPSMMMLWAWAGIPLGVYNIDQNFSIALQIQPQILTTLSLITWIQCLYYQKSWAVTRCVSIAAPLACVMGGIEVGLVYALRRGFSQGIDWPVTLMAVLSALLLAAGVMTHYVDIYRHRTVRGISFLFVGIDAAGDLFSLLSVLFEPSLNILGLVIYGTELCLWIGIMLCGIWYNLLPRLSLRSETRAERSEQIATAPGVATSIALRDLPSSTSVFRTPSGGLVARSIHATASSG